MTEDPDRPAASGWHERNQAVFDDRRVVGAYAAKAGLVPCEERLFEQWIQPGDRVLDLGVGTGRTTPFLAARAGQYVGLDYAPAMVDEARARHPSATFVVGDATDLVAFADGSFDAVVFSYNGIDYLHPDARRAACLRACRRVLVAGTGRMILSRHEPRALVVWPQRPRDGARWWAAAAVMTGRRTVRHLRHRAFWTGSGYVLDPAQGGLLTHMASKRRAVAEAVAAGFRLEAQAAAQVERPALAVVNPWRYYVFRADG